MKKLSKEEIKNVVGGLAKPKGCGNCSAWTGGATGSMETYACSPFAALGNLPGGCSCPKAGGTACA